MISKRKTELILVIVAVVYLFVSLNPFIMWIIPPALINVPLFVVVVSTFLIAVSLGWTETTVGKVWFAIPMSIFMLHTGTKLLGGPEWQFGKVMSFMALIFILFYKASIHLKILLTFRKLMIFFSWVALVVFGATLIGIELPYYRIDGFTLVMQNSYGGEAFYKLYGLVVSSTNTVYSFGGLTVSRICGPFQEPGHFAIYVGLVTIFEKFIFNKISKIFITVGLLTFSPNFLIFLFVIIVYDIFYAKKVKNAFIYISGALFLIGFLWTLGEEIQNEILFLIIGRNFDNVEMSIDNILDNRAGKLALEYYYSFLQGPKLLYGEGVENMEQFGILSDYRGMILKYGLIGLFSSILACLSIVPFAKNLVLRFVIIFVILVVYLQRTWMFESTFVYLFLLIGLISFQYKFENKNEKLGYLQARS